LEENNQPQLKSHTPEWLVAEQEISERMKVFFSAQSTIGQTLNPLPEEVACF
jgi:hypothetical protein